MQFVVTSILERIKTVFSPIELGSYIFSAPLILFSLKFSIKFCISIALTQKSQFFAFSFFTAALHQSRRSISNRLKQSVKLMKSVKFTSSCSCKLKFFLLSKFLSYFRSLKKFSFLCSVRMFASNLVSKASLNIPLSIS